MRWPTSDDDRWSGERPQKPHDSRPGLQGLAPLHQLLVVARHLPAAIDAAVGSLRLKRHQLDVLRLRLKIVKLGGGKHRATECRMFGDVGDEFAVDIDRAAVLERLDVLGAGSHVRHRPLRRTRLPQRVTSATPIATMTAATPFCTNSRPDKSSRPKLGKKTLSTMPKAKTNNVVVEPIACTMLSGANKSA
jgi:hypothetical protein